MKRLLSFLRALASDKRNLAKGIISSVFMGVLLKAGLAEPFGSTTSAPLPSQFQERPGFLDAQSAPMQRRGGT